MKDKNNVGECGTVLNKSANGEEYKWGLRFYVLLIECFREWAAATDDVDITQKYTRIKEIAPILEEDVYYFQALENAPLDHGPVDEIHKYFMSMSPDFRSPRNQQIPDNFPPIIIELDTFKKNFIDSLFSQAPNAQSIVENQIMYQTYFDSIRDQVNKMNGNQAIKNDAKFAEVIYKIPAGDDIETDSGIQKMRKIVSEAMKEIYKEAPRIQNSSHNDNPSYSKSQKIVEANSIPKFNKKEEPDIPYDQKDYEDRNYRVPNGNSKVDKVSKVNDIEINSKNGGFDNSIKETYSNSKTPPYENSKANVKVGKVPRSISRNSDNRILNNEEDFEFPLTKDQVPMMDPENLQLENQKLKEKKQNILKEIERLKEKERNLKESMLFKSDVKEISKIEATPDILIEEINKKSREYDMLKHKYSNLINEMNRKVKTNIEKSMIVNGSNKTSFDGFVNYSKRNFESSFDNNRDSYVYSKQSGFYDRNFL
jgi:hypothetical protein